jgi:multidrug efflux pump subunit AcrA (membrane-fusion protein)
VKRALVVLAACGGGDRIASVGPAGAQTVAKVEKGEVVERVLLTGELRAGQSVEMTVPRTEAWELTIRWMAEDGAQVRAGERVLEFDNSAFTTGLVQKQIAVIEANNAYRTYRDVSAMAIAVKEFELQQAQVALEKAKVLAAVPADLLPQRTVQDRQLDQARAEIALVKAEKDLATEKQAAALESRVKQIELDKARRAVESAEKSIGDLVLEAPRDGLISINNHPWEGRRFQIGDGVQPGFTIVTLPDFSQPMEVKADLSDVDDGRVAVGIRGTCTLDAYPGEALPCEVKEVSPVARTRARQSLRRMFAVTLALDKSDPSRMRPGMSVKVELAGPRWAGLVVPRGAVVFDKGKTGVRFTGGEVKEATVAGCDARKCVIASGVGESDTVALGTAP